MRKDLQAAHLLAAEQNDLDYYKNVLREFEEQRLANLEAKAAKARTPKKKAAERAADDDGDIDMEDVSEGAAVQASEKKSKAKKRKVEEDQGVSSRLDQHCSEVHMFLTSCATDSPAL